MNQSMYLRVRVVVVTKADFNSAALHYRCIYEDSRRGFTLFSALRPNISLISGELFQG